MKKLLTVIVALSLLWACSDSTSDNSGSSEKGKPAVEVKKVDDGKGVGEIKSVTINDPLDEKMIVEGKAVYELKCASCHRLTDKRVTGPGWKGLTEKRKPEWIMNMITNVEMMLEQDAEAQKLLEECLTRMPNQNVSVKEARSILEFMYHNDASS